MAHALNLMNQPRYYDLTSDNQAIAVKMRPDLQVKKVFYQSEPWWVVKDPHDQQYHQYNEQEFAILNWLDGQLSYIELREKFERKFSPCRVSYRELTTIIREFFKKSVVVATKGGNSFQLHEFSREKKRQKLQKKLSNVLAIQWRGWDPDRFMSATLPCVSWFFSPAIVFINVLFMMFALGWLLIHYDEFMTRLPSFWSLLDSSNLVSLALALTGTKILHELGHGYAHKRQGGECHEIGVMVFFLVPTLYCNTSDSWMMRNKWKRMAIGAAGVYVEMVVFSIATFIWWFSSVGLVQDLCINLMVICSISAALTNGNPLMRYDGYFVLSDWLEIPNLAQQSGKEIRRRFLNQCLGITREVDHWTSRSNLRIYMIYGSASFVYKVLLILAISFLLLQRFQDVGLVYPGLVIAVISLASLFVQPIKSMYKYFEQPGNLHRVGRKPLTYTLACVSLVLFLATFVPYPFYVTGECSVEMSGQQTLYAATPGRIQTIHVRPGEYVEAGQLILELEDEELRQQLLDVESQLAETNLRLKYQTTPKLNHDDSGNQDSTSFQSLSTTRRKLQSEFEILQGRQESLRVQAPRDGFVYGLTIGKREADTNDETLNRIYGNPLHEANVGGWLERGDEICCLGDTANPEISLLIEQKQNGLIEVGQETSVLLSSLSNQRLKGQITAVSIRENRASDLPSSIYQESDSPMVAQVKQAANADKRKDINFKDGQTFESTMVQATVKLDDDEATQLNFASVGKVRIYIGSRTLLWRVQRTISEVFQRSF